MITLGTQGGRPTVVSAGSDNRLAKRLRITTVEAMHEARLVPASIPVDTLKRALDAASHTSLAGVDRTLQGLAKSPALQARPDRQVFMEARKRSLTREAQAAGAAALLQKSGVDATRAVSLSKKLVELLREGGIIVVRVDYGDDLRISGPVVYDKSVHQLKARDVTIAPGAVLQFQASNFSMVCRSLMRK
jgi:hypothetical protein